MRHSRVRACLCVLRFRPVSTVDDRSAACRRLLPVGLRGHTRRSVPVATRRAAPMYFMRTKDCPKSDLAKRGALPDRVFFACGGCHILAFAFLERYVGPEMKAMWIKPASGMAGNHVFVAFG